MVVIEDEPLVQELLQDVFRAEGFTVTSVSYARAARRLDPAKSPDVILVDLMLPDMSGVQLAADLRENGFAHTPMIAMSADRIALLLAARSGLFQDTIAKPFELSTLVDMVGKYAGYYVTV